MTDNVARKNVPQLQIYASEKGRQGSGKGRARSRKASGQAAKGGSGLVKPYVPLKSFNTDSQVDEKAQDQDLRRQHHHAVRWEVKE